MIPKTSVCQGSLLGLAAGDALGGGIDGQRWPDIQAQYGPKGLQGYDMTGEGPRITSHTQIAAYAANGLLVALTRRQTDRLAAAAMALREWAKRSVTHRAPDAARCWVSRVPALGKGRCMDARMPGDLCRAITGTVDAPVNLSDGPGSLTAAAAVGLFFAPERMSPAQIGPLAAGIVALTHGSPDAFLSGAVLAYAIAGIVQEPEQPLKAQFLQAAATVRSQYRRRFPQAERVAGKIETAAALAERAQNAPEVMERLGCRTALDCLAGAVYASLAGGEDFDAALVLAVNHSGSSAAVGAITGALLGARLGIGALSEFYLGLDVQPALHALGRDLALGPASTVFDDDWDQKYLRGLAGDIG